MAFVWEHYDYGIRAGYDKESKTVSCMGVSITKVSDPERVMRRMVEVALTAYEAGRDSMAADFRALIKVPKDGDE